MTKSNKIIILLIAFVLSLSIGFGLTKTSHASAATVSSTVKNYFELNGTGISASFEESGLNVNVQNLNKLSFKNDLMINDMDIKVKLPKGYTTGLVFDLDSFLVNGNPEKWSERDSQQGTEYQKTIKNIIKLSYDSNDENKINCTINEKAVNDIVVQDGWVVLKIRVIDNYLTIDGNNIANYYDADEKIYYKVKNIDDRVVVDDLTIDFVEIAQSTAAGLFVMEYVDQKSSDLTGAYKQSLKLEDGQTQLTQAKPRVYLNDTFYARQEDGSYKSIKLQSTEEKYDLTIKACSVLGGYSSVYLVNPTKQDNTKTYPNVLIESDTSIPDQLRFIGAGSNIEFGVGAKENDEFVVYETFVVDEVKVSNFEDTVKPKYVYNEIAYRSYLNALNEAIIVKEDEKITSVGLGTDLKIPSFEDLVFDDFKAYEDLNVNVYYRTETSSDDVATMSFNLKDVGKYIFFVAFSDGENSMLEKDFFITNKDDNNKITYGIYGEENDDGNGNQIPNYVGNFVFRFEIKDDANIEVNKPEIQGKGYKGVKYVASGFDINASGCSIEYQLYYNANINASEDDANWKLIPKASSVSDYEYNENGYDYSEIKSVNYDGELTFVPTRIGSYKIVCTASSVVSSREASDFTIISVASEPKVVEVESQWLQNNIWSVVFLSVGSLCLVGIIILLCIKPKEKVNND